MTVSAVDHIGDAISCIHHARAALDQESSFDEVVPLACQLDDAITELFGFLEERVDPSTLDAGETNTLDDCAHDWQYTGTAYGGDDPGFHGEGRVLCRKCGADGDA